MIVTAYPSSDGTRVEFARASHELTTSDLCSIDFDLRLSRCRSKNNRRKDKSCNNGRAAHDPCSLSRPCEDKPTRSSAIIDTTLQGHVVQLAFSRVMAINQLIDPQIDAHFGDSRVERHRSQPTPQAA